MTHRYLFRITVIVGFIIVFGYSVLFAQQINTISSRCPSPLQLTKSSVKALANGNIAYTPCAGFSSIFTGNVDFSGATITGAVTGTGTANFVPVWNGTNSLTNSRLSWASGTYLFDITTDDCTFCVSMFPSKTAAGIFRAGATAETTNFISLNETGNEIKATADTVKIGDTEGVVNRTAFSVVDSTRVFTFGAASNLAIFDVTGVLNYLLNRTVTATGTTGNQVINQPAGSVNFAALATQISVTNSMVTADSIILITQNNRGASPDASCVTFNVSAVTGGSFKIVTPVACTAETRVSFLVLN